MSQRNLRSPDIEVKELCGMLDHFFEVPNVTPQYFDKLTGELAKRVYTAVLHVCQGITSEELEQPPLALTECVDNPQHYHDIFPDMLLCKQILHFLAQISDRKFSMEDTLRPDGKRLQGHLSEIMNYMKFREGELAAWTEQHTTKENLVLADKAAKEELAKQEALLAELEAAQQADENEAKVLEPEYQATYQECLQVQKSLIQSQRELTEHQAIYNRLKEKLVGDVFELNSELQKLETLRGKILQSPDRLQSTVESANRALVQEEIQLQEIRKESIQFHEAFASAQKYQRGLADISTMVKEFESMLQNTKKISKALKQLKEAARHLDKEVESAQHANNLSHQNKEAAKENQKAAQERLRSERASSEVSLRNHLEEREEILERDSEIRDKIAESHRKVDAYKALEKSHEEKALKCMENHNKLYKAMMKDFVVWRDALKAAIEVTPPDK